METNNYLEQNNQQENAEGEKQAVNMLFNIGKQLKGTSLTIKGLTIFILTLLLLIPVLMISNLIHERSDRQNEVRKEVSDKWANSQTLTGPILVIPYAKREIKEAKSETTGHTTGYLFFLPENLNIEGVVNPQTRSRSIFDVTVYQSELRFSGYFDPLDLDFLQVPYEDLFPEKAQLFFGLSDFRGIEEQFFIQWDDKSHEFYAGDISGLFHSGGLSSPISLSKDELSQKHTFSIHFKIKGSGDLLFAPIGKTNQTQLQSSWQNPSFTGNFLPNSPAKISDSGFSAEWKILYLNRNYPQIWKDRVYNPVESAYGVSLLQATDSYAKTERSIKYAILFIALTFALYLFIEILQEKKVHLLQYGLVGIALCVFYTLLLSISEYIGFDGAYLIAAIATILLIVLYTKSAFGKWKTAAVFGSILTTLYGFIYILIQLQDGALLFGSIGLFLLLAAAMYYSRKIDWYGR